MSKASRTEVGNFIGLKIYLIMRFTVFLWMTNERVLGWVHINIGYGSQGKFFSELNNSWFQFMIEELSHFIIRNCTSCFVKIICFYFVKIYYVWQTTNRTSIVNPKWSSSTNIYILVYINANINLYKHECYVIHTLFCYYYNFFIEIA